MMGAMDQFDLTVTDIRTETQLIRAITLARPHGEPLPSWEAEIGRASCRERV